VSAASARKHDDRRPRAVILAGGRGSRLSPYTAVIPKPLLPVGGSPILEILVRQLRMHGFTDLTLATGYLSHLIEAILGDGSAHQVTIDYCREREPLGTAGPLTNLTGMDSPFLMINGDVLTTMNFRDLYRAHIGSGSDFTIASHRRIVDTDYGVLHVDGTHRGVRNVIGYEEKPKIPYIVSMGVYVASPEVIAHIPVGRPFDIPDLVLALLDAGRRVSSYLYDGYWLDIGRHEDFEQATADYQKLEQRLLGELSAEDIAAES
jgi:NDP-sugar pyrophosphorylase family protein